MRHLHTDIDINASAETVWEILLDVAQYSSWNPFVTKVDGTVSTGEQLTIVVETPKGKTMTFKPTVVRVDRPTHFSWLGRLLVRGLFDGEHIFEIESLADDRVKFTQREEFKGILVPVLWKSLDTDTRSGFEAMNRTLKERAENWSRTAPISDTTV